MQRILLGMRNLLVEIFVFICFNFSFRLGPNCFYLIYCFILKLYRKREVIRIFFNESNKPNCDVPNILSRIFGVLGIGSRTEFISNQNSESCADRHPVKSNKKRNGLILMPELIQLESTLFSHQ